MLHDTDMLRQTSDRIERRGLMKALDQSQSLIWFDATGQVVEANDNMMRMLGIGFDDLSELTYEKLVSRTPMKPEALDRLWGSILSGHRTNDERDILTGDGTDIWCSLNYAVLRNASGTARRVLMLTINMTPWTWKPNDAARV